VFNYAVVLSLCRWQMSLSVVDGVVSHPYSPLVITHSTKELIFYHTFRQKSIHTTYLITIHGTKSLFSRLP